MQKFLAGKAILLWISLAGVLTASGCSIMSRLTPGCSDRRCHLIAEKCGMNEKYLARLKQKPLYKFSEHDVDVYLGYLQTAEPNAAKRVVHLARKAIGQPAGKASLGESSFELYDPKPLYRFGKTDDINFVSQTYAMALAYDWRSFLALFIRLRYLNGEIAIEARHLNIAADWLPANSRWLLLALNDDLVGKRVAKWNVTFARKEFYKKWNIAQDAKTVTVKTDYIPYKYVAGVLGELKDADLVTVVTGDLKPLRCAHVGIIAVPTTGTVDIIYSDGKCVREKNLLDFMDRQIERNEKIMDFKSERFYGFQFYRMSSDPIARLRALDGPDAPVITGPRGLLASRFRHPGWVEPRAPLSDADKKAAKKLGIPEDTLAVLKGRPLYEFTPEEIGQYLAYLHEVQPSLRERIAHLARKNVGQPYQLYLLGEFPFETYDDDPLFALHKSDCVVFSEHMYAMGLSKSWEEFFVFLQRIRYKNGEIGVLTRNHYTEAEWDVNNSWLVEDVSKELAGDAAAPMIARTSHKSFFKNRYGIKVDMPELAIDTWFVPTEKVPDVASHLQNGDFVNLIYGNGKECYASHVGLITRSADGTVNFLHSSPPRVREQPLLEYNRALAAENPDRIKEKRAPFRGFKFLRLRDDPIAQLRTIDGPDAPVVKAPLGVTLGPGRRWTPKGKKTATGR